MGCTKPSTEFVSKARGACPCPVVCSSATGSLRRPQATGGCRAYAVDVYVEPLAASAQALRSSFELYRALDTTIEQNSQRKAHQLAIPVLTIAGAKATGDLVEATMKLVADDLQSVVLPDCGHYPAEEAPDAVQSALSSFLAPYRARMASRRNDERFEGAMAKTGRSESSLSGLPVSEDEHEVADVTFASGEHTDRLVLHYRIIGTPKHDENGTATNAVLLLHGTTGDGSQFLEPHFAERMCGTGQPLDVGEYYVIIPDAIGHGGSSPMSGNWTSWSSRLSSR